MLPSHPRPRIALFGGSFDPPHNGHLAIARAAAQRFALDRVLFCPAAQQPLKPRGAKASYEHRLAMVTLLCAVGNAGNIGADGTRPTPCRFEHSTLDAPRLDGGPNYTVDSLRVLRAEHRAADLFVLVGADAFADLPRWHEPATLLTLADWIVVSRGAASLRTLDALALGDAARERIHPLDGIAEPASATAIRHRLAAGDPCADWLPPALSAYIREHDLYSWPTSV